MHEEIFQSLMGQWGFIRELQPGGVVNGEVVFTEMRNSNFLMYKETGIYIDNLNKQYNAEKSYIYELTSNGITIHFEANGKTNGIYHELCFNSQHDSYPLKIQAEHLCNEDMYNGEYSFINPMLMNIACSIIGPIKNYQITTQLFKS